MKIRIAIISSIIVLLVVAGLGYFLLPRSERVESEAVFEPVMEQQFSFELADTDAKRVQGLSGRREIPENYGLLFVFPRADNYGFWMKDMYVSIDIAWLSNDGTVLKIDEAVSPDTYPQAFYPPSPVRFVLETKAGEMRRQGWDEGMRVPLP